MNDIALHLRLYLHGLVYSSTNMNDRDTGAADGVGLNLPPTVVNPDDPLLIA